MPIEWRPNNHVTFNKWMDCPRCGLPWPEKTYRMQNGILVCPECWDQPSHSDAMREAKDLTDLPKVTDWPEDEKK